MNTVKRVMLITILLASHLCINAQIKISEKYNLMPWPQEVKANDQKFLISGSHILVRLIKDVKS